MQITIDTADMSAADAMALAALLVAQFPAEVQRIVTGTPAPYMVVNVTPATSVDAPKIAVSGTYGKLPDSDKIADKLIAEAQTQLDPADNPATGTASAAEVFTQGVEPQPSASLTMTTAAEHSYDVYRAAGWTDDALIAAGYALPPAGNATASEAARVFGGTGGPLTLSSGEQPAPSNTGVTSPLQSGDAMSVFAAPSATPAPSVAPAPASAAATTNAPELDADGLPWDGRIHASTRTKTAKGVWKKMRGVDDGLVAQVTSELRATVATAKAAAFVPLNAATAPSAPPPPPPPAAQNAVVVPPPPPNAATATPSDAPPPPPPAAVNFVDVAKFVGDHRITGAQVTQVCSAHGISGLALLTQRKELCAPVLADFKKLAGVA